MNFFLAAVFFCVYNRLLITIQKLAQAGIMRTVVQIRQHPKCCFKPFAFAGKYYLDKRYYVAGNVRCMSKVTNHVMEK